MFYRKEKKIKELEKKVAGLKDAIDAKYIEKKQLLEDLGKITEEKNEYRDKYMALQMELETARAVNRGHKKDIKHLMQIKEKMPAAINMILDAVENIDEMIQDGETPCIVPRGKFE